MTLGELIAKIERAVEPPFNYDLPVEVITSAVESFADAYDEAGGDVLQIKEVKYAPTLDRILIYVAPQD